MVRLTIFLLAPCSSSPIVTKSRIEAANGPLIPNKLCLLPPELGNKGEVKFLEDCSSLGRYQTVPLPGDFSHKLGTHTVVCCPQDLPKSSICFASDVWCPSFKAPDYQANDLKKIEKLNNDYENIPEFTYPSIWIQEN